MLEKLTEKQSLWEHLKQTDKPIFLYGMGDGADKIIESLNRYHIPLSGIYASDEFVRGQSFHGFKIQRYQDIKTQHHDFIALLAFAINYEPMLSILYQMNTECEFYAPDVPVIKTDGTLFDLNYIRKNENKLDLIYNQLADEKSKKVFLNTLNFKISGKINYLKEITTEKNEVFNNILCPNETETYIDLGGYKGDTVQEFLTMTNEKYKKIIVLEPDTKNFSKLSEFLTGMHNTKAYQIAAWSKPCTLFLKGGKGGRNSQLSDSKTDKTIPIHADSIDRLPNGLPATLMKLDIEGAEAEALEGAYNTIRNFHPKLIVSAYHKNEDIFALPLQILSYYPNYKMYLRHHPYIPAWETNYYFIPK